MIKVVPRRAPRGFRPNVRDPGHQWLRSNAHRDLKRPRAYWNEWPHCREALARMFAHRCGYTACRIPGGEVEHFISWAECKQSHRRELAYEWTNYRWILPQLNGRKGTREVLDPFEVENDWFELNLHSLHLDLTDAVPPEMHDVARRTLETLGLDRSEVVVRMRNEALELYRAGTSLEGIERYSPLVARALRKLEEAEEADLKPEDLHLRRHLQRKRAASRRQ